MGNVLVENKTVVVPGERIAEGMDYLPGFGTYRKDNDILAARLGLAITDSRAIKIIPLSGRYTPRKDDVIIGKIIDVTMNGWRAEINSAYTAMLMLKDGTTNYVERGADLTRYFKIGDYIMTRISNVSPQKLIDLTMKGPGLKKLIGGRVLKVNPLKVPRIIGKSGSMVSVIKDATGCRILVGQNGVVWISGEPANEVIAVNTIKKIEAESHVQGLTDKIKEYLEGFKDQLNTGKAPAANNDKPEFKEDVEAPRAGEEDMKGEE